MADQHHETLAAPANAETKVLRSRFLAVVMPVRDTDEFKLRLAEIAEQHRTANHHCWAYVLGRSGETTHCSDAGEPAGSAGKPILNVLRRHRLSNIAAVVTRYFGGIKLGVRGLIEAYGEAAELALDGVTTIPLVERVSWRIEAPYDLLETIRHRLRGIPAECDGFVYDTGAKFIATANEEHAERVETLLGEFPANRVRVERVE